MPSSALGFKIDKTDVATRKYAKKLALSENVCEGEAGPMAVSMGWATMGRMVMASVMIRYRIGKIKFTYKNVIS
jgi:hypothetical protein